MELDIIQNKVFTLRGFKVILDFDLAEMYGVETKALKQAVRRNTDRFPSDFMFELSQNEFIGLRSQYVTPTRGGNRYLPFAFTEPGIAMLSSVLRSEKAVQISIEIIRTVILPGLHD
ncbi:hypothetical protein DYBT9623_02466 [Dyadobacter sp. CECT 9623]|uniref:KilA-N DNA-binding domain-containing protein n=1 Tax=Dyadobacter linearis TaxID=2823330 RepID=A0ABN7R8G3_9BACT|nr:ORF6N domain-containing protein [Dyadobacter sp. CECT 9623]CAG5069729.1 hypothetical protein DYBT9623_02466 [Dyadobacter sp. CECT 9623]